jgi:hypothetical protein
VTRTVEELEAELAECWEARRELSAALSHQARQRIAAERKICDMGGGFRIHGWADEPR